MKALGMLMLSFFFIALMYGLNQDLSLMENVQHSVLVFIIFSVLILLISLAHNQSANNNLKADLERKKNTAPDD